MPSLFNSEGIFVSLLVVVLCPRIPTGFKSISSGLAVRAGQARSAYPRKPFPEFINAVAALCERRISSVTDRRYKAGSQLRPERNLCSHPRHPNSPARPAFISFRRGRRGGLFRCSGAVSAPSFSKFFRRSQTAATNESQRDSNPSAQGFRLRICYGVTSAVRAGRQSVPDGPPAPTLENRSPNSSTLCGAL